MPPAKSKDTMARPSSLQIAFLSAGLWLAATTLGFAGPLLEARVTKIINVVNVVEPARGSHPASFNELIKDEVALKTGVKSRSELLFQDNTLTRIGPETYFSFKAGTRDMTLEQGTLLLQVPKGIGGAKIRTAAVTASITGTTIMMEYRPGHDLKVLVLEGSLRLSLNGRLGEQISLRPGQMIMMPPDAKKIPQPVHVDLKQVMKTSSLVNMSTKGNAPLPSVALIQKSIDEQTVEKSNNTLVATNLTIEGKGTDVVVATDSLIAAVSRHDDATSGVTQAGNPQPTPVPVATPAPTPTPDVNPTPNPSPSPASSATPQPTVSPQPTASATPRSTATPGPLADTDLQPNRNPPPRPATAVAGDQYSRRWRGGDDDGKNGKKKKHDEHAPPSSSPNGQNGNDSSAAPQLSGGKKPGTKMTLPLLVNRDRVIHLKNSEQLVSLMETSTNGPGGRVRVQLPAQAFAAPISLVPMLIFEPRERDRNRSDFREKILTWTSVDCTRANACALAFRPNKMEIPSDGSKQPAQDAGKKAASELNNLLEIISGTSDGYQENVGLETDGLGKSFSMRALSSRSAAPSCTLICSSSMRVVRIKKSYSIPRSPLSLSGPETAASGHWRKVAFRLLLRWNDWRPKAVVRGKPHSCLKPLLEVDEPLNRVLNASITSASSCTISI